MAPAAFIAATVFVTSGIRFVWRRNGIVRLWNCLSTGRYISRKTRGPQRVHFAIRESVLNLCLMADDWRARDIPVQFHFGFLEEAVFNRVFKKGFHSSHKGCGVNCTSWYLNNNVRLGQQLLYWPLHRDWMAKLWKPLETYPFRMVWITETILLSGLGPVARPTSPKSSATAFFTKSGISAIFLRTGSLYFANERDWVRQVLTARSSFKMGLSERLWNMS